MIIQIFLAILGAFLSVVLTKFLIQNGREIRELRKDTNEGFRRMDERTQAIIELIRIEGEKTRAMIRT